MPSLLLLIDLPRFANVHRLFWACVGRLSAELLLLVFLVAFHSVLFERFYSCCLFAFWCLCLLGESELMLCTCAVCRRQRDYHRCQVVIVVAFATAGRCVCVCVHVRVSVFKTLRTCRVLCAVILLASCFVDFDASCFCIVCMSVMSFVLCRPFSHQRTQNILNALFCAVVLTGSSK